MKRSLLVLAAIACTAIADVKIFTNNDCTADEELIQTDAGHCYNVPETHNSAKGCSDGHDIRVFTLANCVDGDHADNGPQACVNLGGRTIRSVMCLN